MAFKSAPDCRKSVRDAFDGILTGQLRWSPSGADNLDNLWDAVNSDLDGLGAGDSTALVKYRGRCEVTVNRVPAPATAPHPLADQPALDRYFALAADNADQAPENE